MRIILHWGLHRGPLILGNYHIVPIEYFPLVPTLLPAPRKTTVCQEQALRASESVRVPAMVSHRTGCTKPGSGSHAGSMSLQHIGNTRVVVKIRVLFLDPY